LAQSFFCSLFFINGLHRFSWLKNLGNGSDALTTSLRIFDKYHDVSNCNFGGRAGQPDVVQKAENFARGGR
jgi:hypothetical protein